MDGSIARLYESERLEAGLARGFRLRPKPFVASFHPFAGLRATIFDRGDHFEVRMSDLLRDAPEPVQRSLARILVGKINRRLRSNPAERRPYVAWSRSSEIVSAHEEARRLRGRKRMGPARGGVHDLDRLFDRLNLEYFGGGLAKPRLGWSLQRNRRLYGHHDPVHGAIVINRLLDHPRVPESVVASILHHEMLHVKHGVRIGDGGRRIMHSREFRRDETVYREQREAKIFLRDLEQRRIRLRQPTFAEPAGLLRFLPGLFRAGQA